MIKLDAYGYGSSQREKHLEYHVNAPFKKMPQLDMELKHERDGDMISIIRNIAPSTDRSYSSGLNGLDPKQMNDKG